MGIRELEIGEQAVFYKDEQVHSGHVTKSWWVHLARISLKAYQVETDQNEFFDVGYTSIFSIDDLNNDGPKLHMKVTNHLELVGLSEEEVIGEIRTKLQEIVLMKD